jgi:hypothetical protein
MGLALIVLGILLVSFAAAALTPWRWVLVMPVLSVIGSGLWWYILTADDRAAYQGGDCSACIAVIPAMVLCFVSLIGIVMGAFVNRRRPRRGSRNA